MDSLRSNDFRRGRESICFRPAARRAASVLAVFVALSFFHATPLTAQTAPAALPDLKLFTAGSVNAIAVQDDQIIISGNFVSVNDVPRTNLARLNSKGTNLNWNTDLNWNPKISGEVSSIVPSGINVYLGGYTVNSGTYKDMLLVKLNAAGDTVFTRVYNGAGNNADDILDLALDAAGNIYITGYQFGDISNDKKFLAFGKPGSSTADSDVYLYNTATKEMKNITPHTGDVAVICHSELAPHFYFFKGNVNPIGGREQGYGRAKHRPRADPDCNAKGKNNEAQVHWIAGKLIRTARNKLAIGW